MKVKDLISRLQQLNQDAELLTIEGTEYNDFVLDVFDYLIPVASGQKFPHEDIRIDSFVDRSTGAANKDYIILTNGFHYTQVHKLQYEVPMFWMLDLTSTATRASNCPPWHSQQRAMIAIAGHSKQ
jgi:hypothetical protein